MTFSDDDLWRLKDSILLVRGDRNIVGILKGDLEALLARLEAAEAFLIESDQPRYSMSREQAELFNAWRKSKGSHE